MGQLSESDSLELEARLRTVFKPGTPVNSFELFCGRRSQTSQVLAAINQNGQHVILFGERGVGKTSLANILFYLVDCPGWPKTTPIVNCTRTDTYGTVWARVFGDILDRAEKDGIVIPKKAIRPMKMAREGFVDMVTMDVVKSVLTTIGEKAMTVVVLDEFDMLNPTVRASVADTIKYLSDRNAPCTIMAVGVADDVNGLIADHESVERCLIQVRMPRMSASEQEAIIKKCLEKVGMTIDDSACNEITRIAKGLPHYAHLLGLHSGVMASRSRLRRVNADHVHDALEESIENALQSIQAAYLRATESSQRTAKYEELLIACAMAETNEHGYFSPADVRAPLSRILNKPAKIENFGNNLHAFCESAGGSILDKITIRSRPQFRFHNALMQPFAIMKGLARKIITEADLMELQHSDEDQRKLF